MADAGRARRLADRRHDAVRPGVRAAGGATAGCGAGADREPGGGQCRAGQSLLYGELAGLGARKIPQHQRRCAIPVFAVAVFRRVVSLSPGACPEVVLMLVFHWSTPTAKPCLACAAAAEPF